MRRAIFFAAPLLATFSAAAFAEDQGSDKANKTPPVFQAVLDCKTVTDPTERLTCYDRTVEVMSSASAKRDILVAERTTVEKAEKGLFGLKLPNIKIFGGNDSGEVKEIESTITSFRRDENGALIITIADGARWRQTDIGFQSAKVGDKIKIRKAALGSFFANINGRSGMKMTRLAN
jgi:hypothetical protein